MSKPVRPGEATRRRDFLRTLVLAPAAATVAAGCATPGGAARPAEASGDPAAARADADADASLRAIRAHPLAMDAEPAFLFRAAPARPGE